MARQSLHIPSEAEFQRLTACWPKRRNPGTVYFIRRTDGLVKVGRTGNLTERMKTIARDVGQQLTVLATIDAEDCAWTERQLHWRLAAYRVINEWFSIDENQVQSMITLYGGSTDGLVPLV